MTFFVLLFMATFKMTAQIDKKWSGRFGTSIVYEPPFQKVYIPIGTDLIQFNPTLKLRVNGELDYHLTNRIEIDLGAGLGNVGVQPKGVTLDPEVIQTIDREFNPESLAAFNRAQAGRFNPSFDHGFIFIGGFYSLGPSAKSFDMGVRYHLPFYFNTEYFRGFTQVEYEDVATVYRSFSDPTLMFEFLLRKPITIKQKEMHLTFSAFYNSGYFRVRARTLMATNRASEYYESEYLVPNWNFIFSLSFPLF
jgi:hypothetical protein